MNLFDLFVVIVVAGLGIVGFREGLVRGILNLVGFIALIILLKVFSEQVAMAGRSLVSIPEAIAIPLVFIGFLFIGTAILHLVSMALYKLIHLTPVGFIDSGLGTLLGMLKAFFFCAFIALVLSFSPDGTFFRRQYETSASAPELILLLHATIPFVAETFEPLFDRMPAAPGEYENEATSDDII